MPDGLDSERQHGQRSVLLRHKSQAAEGQYSICVGRSGNVRDGCGGGQAGLALFLAGPFREGGCR